MCAHIRFVNDSGDSTLSDMVVEVPDELKNSIDELVKVLEKTPPIERAYTGMTVRNFHVRTPLPSNRVSRKYLIGWDKPPKTLEDKLYMNKFMLKMLDLTMTDKFDEIKRSLSSDVGIDTNRLQDDPTNVFFKNLDYLAQSRVIDALTKYLGKGKS